MTDRFLRLGSGNKPRPKTAKEPSLKEVFASCTRGARNLLPERDGVISSTASNVTCVCGVPDCNGRITKLSCG